MKRMRFEIPSDPKHIKTASTKLADFLEGMEFSKESLFDLRLCLEEAVINAIKYGNKLDSGLPVVIEYLISDGNLEVIVRDKGKGFKFDTVPDPRSEENILKHGGRGLFLIKNLMDKVEFNDSGNEIKMIKSITGGKPNGDQRKTVG
ncbi:MAG: ATP-binding protein [Candidatus Omnitrophota bacterium]